MTLRIAGFGSLLRVLWSWPLRALACAGLYRHALAGCRGRAGVQRRVEACKVLCRSLCNVVQCEAAVVCVVPVVYGR